MASKLGTLTLDLVCRVGNFTQAMREASGSASREMGRIESSTNGATNAIKGMAAMVVSAFSVSQISNYADSYTEIINKLKLVTVNQGQLNQAVGDTHRIAQITASEWSAVNDVYSKYMSNAKALNLTQQEVARLTEITSKAVSISGSNSQAAAGALFQYGQALDGNILRAEEYNSLVDGAGGLLNAMAKGLNTTRGGLRQMMLDGKLTGEVIADALMKAGSNVDELYSKTATTVAASFNLVKNESIRLIGEFDSATGASATFVKGMGALAQNIDLATKGMMVGAAYMAGSYIPAIYQSVAAKKAKIISTFEEIQAENAAIIQTQRKAQAEHTAAQAEMTRARDAVISAEMQVNADRAVIASEIQRMQSTIAATNVEKAQEAQRLRSQINDVGKAQSISRMAQLQQVQAIQVAELTALEAKLGATTLATSRVYEAARNTQTAATNRLATATAGLNAANAMSARSSFGLLGALGGPVGLGLTVAAVAASYLLLKDSADESTKSLRENNESVDEAIEKYRELDEARRDSQIIAEKEQLKELAKSYDNATDSLITNAYALTRHNDVTTVQAKELNALIAEFKETKNLEDFRSKIKALTFINQESKDKFVVLAGAVSKTGSEYKTQQSLIEKMISLSPNAVKATDERTAAADREKKAIEAANKAYADYSKSALTDIKEMAARKYYQDLGYSKNRIDGRITVLKALDYDPAKAHSQSGIEMKKLADINAKMKDDEEARTKAIEEQNKKLEERNKILEKTINSKTIDSVIARGEGNYNSFNRGKAGDSVGQKLNLTNMTVGQIRAMQKDRGGSLFAVGKYQTIPSTLQGAIDAGIVSTAEKFNAQVQERIVQNYLLTAKKGRGSIEDYIRGRSDNIDAANLDLAKEFASVANPYTGKSYHGKVGNNKASISIKDAQDALKASRTLYLQAIASGKNAQEAWKAAFNSSITFVDDSDAQKALDKLGQDFLKLQQEKAQFSQQFSSEDVIRNQKRIDDIAEAERLGLQHLIPKIKEYYKAQGQLAHLHYIEEVNGYKWSEEQKIAHTRLVDQQQLILSTQYTDAEKKIVNKAIDDRAAYELAIFNETQRRKAQELSDVLTEQQKQSSRNQLRFIAQATMNPSEYARWSLQNNMTDDVAHAFEDYEKNVSNINRKDEAGRFEIEDANVRNQLLQQAERTHQAKMLEIKEYYAAQAKDLAQSQYESQLSIWSSLLGQAQNTWSQMTQAVKDSEGEQSSAFKTMFLMQQSMAFASAIVSAHLAAVQTTADITLPFVGKVPAASAILAFGYANAGMIAGQTIAGMAHDGIDNVPREGTWLLDRGERVVDRRTNSDLKDYLADRSKQGAQIVINNNSSANVRAQQGGDGKVYVTIDEVERYVNNSIQNPNSSISRTMSQNYNSQRRR